MTIKQLMQELQTWLTLEGRCPGCGRLLEEGKKAENQDNTIICECSRVFIYNQNSKVYEKSGAYYYQLEAVAEGRRQDEI